MLPRYFNAMIRAIKNSGIIADDDKLKKHLYNNGFAKLEIDEHFAEAKKRAVEQVQKAKANGGKLPIRVRIFDAVTDIEESSFVCDNYLPRERDDWLRAKILYAVNNRKAVEISALDD